MPCPFTDPKMFCASPNFLSQPKNLTAFSVSSKTFVPAQKTILLNANHLFVWHKMSVTGTIQGRGVFSTGAMGALAPAILKNRLLAPAIFGHFSTVGKNCG